MKAGPLYLVLDRALLQQVQLLAQLVDLLADVVHLSAEPLVVGQLCVKLPFVALPLLLRGDLRVQPAVRVHSALFFYFPIFYCVYCKLLKEPVNPKTHFFLAFKRGNLSNMIINIVIYAIYR